MSKRRVDIRTSRKPNPVQETNPIERSTRSLRTTHSVKPSARVPKSRPKHLTTLKKPSNVKKILKNTKVLPKITSSKHKLVSKRTVEPPNSIDYIDDMKPRRRRLDAEDYIKRRFLYEDEPEIKRQRNKSNFVAKRMTQLSPRFRTSSTAALMAASSANLLQRKRRRHHDENATFAPYISLPPARSRRGRKPKQRPDYDPGNHDETLDEFLPPANPDSETDEQTFSDDGTSPLTGRFSRRTTDLQHHDRSTDDSDDILKPLFHKPHKSRSYRHPDESFSPENLQDSPNHHFAEFSDLMLQDRMTDLTRTRGPTVLSKRARHRIAPRPMCKPEPLKQISHYPDFGPHGLNDAFHHHHHQQQHPDMDDMDQFPEDLGDGIEMPPQHRDAAKLGFPLNVGGHQEMVGIHHRQHSQLLNSASGSPLAPQLPPQPVDVEEFAGDLLPQRMALAPPVTGSSRRKSPIRPMQVVRTEPLIYHDPIGDRSNRDARSYMMEPIHHPRYIGSSGANLIQQKQLPNDDTSAGFTDSQQQSQHIHPGLVDLCAAAHGELADMHSAAAAAVVESYNISPTPTQQHQQHGLVDFMNQAGNITSTAANPASMHMQPQISVVNPNLVAVQPSRIFVETSGGTPNLVRSGLTSYGMPVKTSVTKYSSYTPSKAMNTSSSMSSGGNMKSTGGGGGTSTRRRPTILKRGAGSGSSGGVSCSLNISPSIQSQQQQLNSQTIISYTSLGNTTCLPMLSPANAPRLQPPFMRAMGAFTPGPSGFHKLSLINSNGSGVGGLPSDHHPSFSDSAISTGGSGGQLLRLVSANNNMPTTVTYAVVSSAPSLISTTASPSINNHNNRVALTTTQTASSRLFGRRSQVPSMETHRQPQPLTFISGTNVGGAPLLATQRATPLRYTVVRGAADGKKYVLLGTPSNSFQRSEDVGGMQLNIQDGSEMDSLEQTQQEGVAEENVEAMQLATNWSGSAAGVTNSSVILSSQKSSSPESTVVS